MLKKGTECSLALDAFLYAGQAASKPFLQPQLLSFSFHLYLIKQSGFLDFA